MQDTLGESFNVDMTKRINFSLMRPTASLLQVMGSGYRFNIPLRKGTCSRFRFSVHNHVHLASQNFFGV
jgi:hypothetical protein